MCAMGISCCVYIEKPSTEDICLKHKHERFVICGCRNCRTHLSSSTQLMSKDYRGKTGDAYLMNEVVNVFEGERQTRYMITGKYVVCDIFCSTCGALVGWRYLKSEKSNQQYKEGKYILELLPITQCR